MGCAGDFERGLYNHAGGGRLWFWNGCDRGWSSCLAAPSICGRGSPDIRMVPQIFTGRSPFSKLTAPVITSKILAGKRPARPGKARELGLTDWVWDITVRCWRQDPAQRPTMREVVRLLREWPVFSLSPWNRHRDVPPAAIVWLLCGPKSRISQLSS